MAETNAELARRGFEAAQRGDLEVIGAMLDPDVKWHGGDPTAEGTCQNREQALKFMLRASQGGANRGGANDAVDPRSRPATTQDRQPL